ncbi:T9SS type A sorting domain-containing protein [candidate division KSB1 bacterium]|nr:T9SS type A sorting domain-containing protein [candidate division KSB1 bacterium]
MTITEAVVRPDLGFEQIRRPDDSLPTEIDLILAINNRPTGSVSHVSLVDQQAGTVYLDTTTASDTLSTTFAQSASLSFSVFFVDTTSSEVSPTVTTSIEILFPAPTTFSLAQNFPNPFNPGTMIQYDLPEEARVTLKIYNMLGQEVKTLVDAVQPAQRHSARWDGTDNSGLRVVAAGIYFYQIQAGSFSKTNKMILMR